MESMESQLSMVLLGDVPLLIDESLPTLSKMLQKADYVTAIVDKWHS